MRRVATWAVGGAVGGFVGAALYRSLSPPSDPSWAAHVPERLSMARPRPQVLSVAAPLFGVDRLRRMQALQLATGGVLVYSGTCLSGAALDALDALVGRTADFRRSVWFTLAQGPVELIVVPNGMHRMDAARYRERYPTARVVCPAAARARVSEVVTVDATYEEVFGPDNAWGIRHYPAPMKAGYEESTLVVPTHDGASVMLVCDFLQVHTTTTTRITHPHSFIWRRMYAPTRGVGRGACWRAGTRLPPTAPRRPCPTASATGAPLTVHPRCAPTCCTWPRWPRARGCASCLCATVNRCWMMFRTSCATWRLECRWLYFNLTRCSWGPSSRT